MHIRIEEGIMEGKQYCISFQRAILGRTKINHGGTWQHEWKTGNIINCCCRKSYMEIPVFINSVKFMQHRKRRVASVARLQSIDDCYSGLRHSLEPRHLTRLIFTDTVSEDRELILVPRNFTIK